MVKPGDDDQLKKNNFLMFNMAKKEKNTSEYKLVIVTRDDLSLSAGKLAAQVAHAAVACALKTKKEKSIWFSKWYAEGGKTVVVRAQQLADFFDLEDKAKKLGLISALIVDAGHTEIPEGTATVLGIGPGPSALVDPLTGSLPLV